MGSSVEALQDQIQSCLTQRQNLESIFNSVMEGIIAVDLDLRVINMNQAAQEITGFSHREVIGKSCLTLLEGATRRDDLCEIFQQHRPLERYRTDLIDRHGHEHQLEISIHLLKDDEGHDRGLVTIIRDVTELETLRTQLTGRNSFYGMIGKHHRMQEIYQLIEDLSDSTATVLIMGETGTGKELVAAAIHRSSHRSDGPFVKVNCSALSEGLLESELFGHVKGAFTGAIRDKVGRFELASNGTIFLDEIGDLSPNVQVKLLRVLQEREIERVGSTRTVRVDTRVIAATHRNLEEGVREGYFRDDLYYRLNVMPIEIPPLRDRTEDMPLLVDHFIKKFNAQTSRRILNTDDAAMAILMDYAWPGNIRQLENAIEHAFIKCRRDILSPACLPPYLTTQTRSPATTHAPIEPPPAMPTHEKDHVLQVLGACHWNRSEAAERLGMHRTTLWRKLKEWNVVE